MIRFSHAFHIKLEFCVFVFGGKNKHFKNSRFENWNTPTAVSLECFKTETLQRQCRWHVWKLKHANDSVAGMFLNWNTPTTVSLACFKTETPQRRCRWHVWKLKHSNDAVAGMSENWNAQSPVSQACLKTETLNRPCRRLACKHDHFCQLYFNHRATTIFRDFQNGNGNHQQHIESLQKLLLYCKHGWSLSFSHRRASLYK